MVLGLPLQGMQDGGILTQLYMVASIVGFLIFPLMVVFGPRLLVWRADRRLQSVMVNLDEYRSTAEDEFLEELQPDRTQRFEEKYDALKDFKLSPPTGIDPAGLVGKFENVLDASDSKFERFVKRNASTEDEDELADMQMAFRGVLGTHQVFKMLRHYRQLINKTQNFQLVSIVQFMVPIYTEIAEAQKDATRAFADGAPIGDAIGPLVAAQLIEDEPEEVAENIVHSEEEIMDTEVHIIKSDGPGARLGKYGDAIDKVAEENDLAAVITVDAAAKLEGEDTGAISEGAGVMMGGPGVEKSKIEDAAEKHGVPLEGIIVKQSPSEASKPMKKEIYNSWENAVDRVQRNLDEFDGPVAVIGVGNTCGVGNKREDTSSVKSKLQPYWEEYEEEEEEEVSYVGLMATMGGGGEQVESFRSSKNDLLMRLPRLV